MCAINKIDTPIQSANPLRHKILSIKKASERLDHRQPLPFLDQYLGNPKIPKNSLESLTSTYIRLSFAYFLLRKRETWIFFLLERIYHYVFSEVLVTFMF